MQDTISGRIRKDKMTQKFVERWHADEIHTRLVNWGTWLRQDNTYSKLGYPDQSPFIFCARKGNLIADLDAQHIEMIVSTLYMRDDFSQAGSISAFILRVEYAERNEQSQPHVSQKAHDVKSKYNCRCGRSTYYDKLKTAKATIRMLAGPIR